jgi:hypothetical protein
MIILLLKKNLQHEIEETAASEFEKVEVELHSLITLKTTKSDYITPVENVHNLLGIWSQLFKILKKDLSACLGA